jgi:hypothetical protein
VNEETADALQIAEVLRTMAHERRRGEAEPYELARAVHLMDRHRLEATAICLAIQGGPPIGDGQVEHDEVTHVAETVLDHYRRGDIEAVGYCIALMDQGMRLAVELRWIDAAVNG